MILKKLSRCVGRCTVIATANPLFFNNVSRSQTEFGNAFIDALQRQGLYHQDGLERG
ncbi:MAG: hypothetical protein KAI83_08360 [Thiomargarita sp.]|nr:hypothetical protein [Thiomargarita sp.]